LNWPQVNASISFTRVGRIIGITVKNTVSR
jgi:hypothetical protein